MTKPITPDQVIAENAKKVPDFIIGVFNALIAACWDGEKSVVMQMTAIDAILQETNFDLNSTQVISRGWMEVEDVYRAVGWNVTYQGPNNTISYGASFTFRRR